VTRQELYRYFLVTWKVDEMLLMTLSQETLQRMYDETSS